MLDYVKHFCQDINSVFGKEYLRKPNAIDIDHLLQVAEARGFPGMLGSLDCMHWKWKNCPTKDVGAYRGRNKGCTIILEAVASYDTWIWHAFFGLPGTNNDINVLNKSHLFRDLENGTSLPANYFIKGRNYNVGYYLTDGIYPKWSTLVQTISHPTDQKEMYFVKQQEAYRKDVERAFGVLQARFAIVRGGARLWNKSTVQDVMNACIIMHNMIVEDERSGYLNTYVFDESPHIPNIEYESSPTMPEVTVMRNLSNESYVKWLRVHREIMNAGEHDELQARLVQHLWDIRGEMSD